MAAYPHPFDIEIQRPSAKTLHNQSRSWFKSLLKEPFIHFIILGIVLFNISEYLEQQANQPAIIISPSQIEAISENYRLQYGQQPNPVQLKGLIDNLIKEQIFYHEALKLKLDQEDEIIRRRLVQKFEFLQQDLSILSEPTAQDLIAFYQSHPENYQIPAKTSFSHIFFSTDQRGLQGARNAALANLARLNKTQAVRAPELGDTFPGLYDYAQLSQTEVSRLFGKNQLAETVFSAPLNTWFGPVQSGYGWHLIRVNAIQPATTASFDTVKDAVSHDLLETTRKQNNAESLEKLKKNFRIQVG